MRTAKTMRWIALLTAVSLIVPNARLEAARLAGLHVVDQEYLLVHVLDGEVVHTEDAQGPTAYKGGHDAEKNQAIQFTPHLDTDAAGRPGSWRISSPGDPAYATETAPAAVHRKSRPNGHAQEHWVDARRDFHYDYTFEHCLFLKMPTPMTQGHTYHVNLSRELNLDKDSAAVRFDIFRARSEALHANLVGYPAGHTASADLYIWMGDAGARNYEGFEDHLVHLCNVAAGTHQTVGQVEFWRENGADVGWFDLTRSPVWTVDAALTVPPGTYRIAVDGIGCTADFRVGDNVYRHPFRVAVQGYYYMRIGEPIRNDIRPVPRQPRYIPGKDPEGTVVYLTTMHPWHTEWKTFAPGDVWDKPDAWKRFRKAGNPTNADAWGGHSDAADWDRHLAHVANIYDMLLPYILTNGALDDDDIGIAESGNGIPDLLDEARNEVDFWLRLRDGEGYSHGLTGPTKQHEFFQAAPTAIAAWANAVNCAMLADAFRVAGDEGRSATYRDHAIAAFKHADSLEDPMLDDHQELGMVAMKGRDFKMTAAAYLYNVTGDTAFEDVVIDLSVCTGPEAVLDDYVTTRSSSQLWGTAGYLSTSRPVHAPELQANMRAALVHQAGEVEAGLSLQRPTRRSCHLHKGYFRTAHCVNHTLIGHAFATTNDEREFLLTALLREAGYGLGRNPMNMVQMTTATTPLARLRSVEGAYTTGRNDGSPGLHPGHTPYMNLDDWNAAMTMGAPSKLHGQCYPADFKETWPIGEGYFNTRWVWAHNEFTPRQTMRGKMALYAYLHGLERKGKLGRSQRMR